MDLTVTSSRIGDAEVLALAGLADLSSAPRLHDALSRLTATPRSERVVVDLDGLTAIDDTALGLLLGAAASARSGGSDLTLVCTNERIRARLATTRLDRVMTVTNSIA